MKEEVDEPNKRKKSDGLQIREKELESILNNLERNCSFIRCMLISSVDSNPLGIPVHTTFVDMEVEARKMVHCDYKDMEVVMETLRNRVKHKQEIQRSLRQQVSTVTEDNSCVYDTLNEAIKEKEQLKQTLETTHDELETCETVIQFLIMERDHLKMDIENQDLKLAEYRETYQKHKSVLLPAQNSLHPELKESGR